MSTGCIIGLVAGILGGIVVVIIAIVAVLASLGVATGQKVLAQARDLQTKATIKGLELAIRGYQTEYNKLPEIGTTDEATFVESKGPLLDIITATDASKNPRGIQFYDPPMPTKSGKGGGISDSSGKLLEVRDPFGSPYRLHFDWNDDGKIPDPEHPGSDIPAKVIIYSAGSDLDYNTWKDNVTSWKP